MLRSVRCRALWCLGRSARSPAPWSAMRPDLRSRAPGDLTGAVQRDTAGRPRSKACAARERKPSGLGRQECARRGVAQRGKRPGSRREAVCAFDRDYAAGADAAADADAGVSALTASLQAPATVVSTPQVRSEGDWPSPTVAAAPRLPCRRLQPRPWPRRCRAARAQANSGARRSRYGRRD